MFSIYTKSMTAESRIDYQNNPESWNILYDQVKGLIRKICINLGVYSPLDIDEIIQETLATGYAKRHQFDGRQSIIPWISRIAHNKAVDHIRGVARRVTPASLDEIYEKTGADLIEDTEQNLERKVMAREEAQEVLKVLTPRERTLFRLRADGYRDKEIAEKTGLYPGTVKTQVNRAREKVRKGVN